MNTPDVTLAAAAAAGDRAAFGALIQRHYDRVQALGWRLTGDRAAAQDLAQDIFAALPAKLRHWRAEARFSTWLYRVVVNAAHDLRRRQATRARASAGWGDWETARQDEIVAERSRMDWFAHAITQLPADLRDTLALVLGQDMTHAQAGKVLGLSEGTIAWRMSEVKKRLRAIAQDRVE